jgi:hypothetical protein
MKPARFLSAANKVVDVCATKVGLHSAGELYVHTLVVSLLVMIANVCYVFSFGDPVSLWGFVSVTLPLMTVYLFIRWMNKPKISRCRSKQQHEGQKMPTQSKVSLIIAALRLW